MEFAIVEFTADSSVDIVATNWLARNKTVCYWPNVKRTTALEKILKVRAAPGSDWAQFDVRVLHEYGTIVNVITNLILLRNAYAYSADYTVARCLSVTRRYCA